MKLSGLQVSFFKAAEMLGLHLSGGFDAAVELLAPSLSEEQRASLPSRLAGYRHREQRSAEAAARKEMLEARAHERGGARYAKCVRCGSFKSRPSDVCPKAMCGDIPVTYNGSARAHDRAVWGA